MRTLRSAAATACLMAGLGAAGSGLAAPAQPAADPAERLATALAELMPMGRIFELAAQADPKFPLGEKADRATDEQRACLRSELSVDGYRRLKRAEAEAYVRDNSARVPVELKLLESGAARLMGRLVFGGAQSAQEGVEFDAQQMLADAKAEELAGFMAFMTDPNYAGLRTLSGIGDTFNPRGSQAENEKTGEALGYSLGAQYVIRALGACNVPASVYL